MKSALAVEPNPSSFASTSYQRMRSAFFGVVVSCPFASCSRLTRKYICVLASLQPQRGILGHMEWNVASVCILFFCFFIFRIHRCALLLLLFFFLSFFSFFFFYIFVFAKSFANVIVLILEPFGKIE